MVKNSLLPAAPEEGTFKGRKRGVKLTFIPESESYIAHHFDIYIFGTGAYDLSTRLVNAERSQAYHEKCADREQKADSAEDKQPASSPKLAESELIFYCPLGDVMECSNANELARVRLFPMERFGSSIPTVSKDHLFTVGIVLLFVKAAEELSGTPKLSKFGIDPFSDIRARLFEIRALQACRRPFCIVLGFSVDQDAHNSLNELMQKNGFQVELSTFDDACEKTIYDAFTTTCSKLAQLKNQPTPQDPEKRIPERRSCCTIT